MAADGQGGPHAPSNYLLQSILCTLIFYGHVSVSSARDRTEQMLLVGGLTVCQLIWSPMWLSTFRFDRPNGCAHATYWRLQPMVVRLRTDDLFVQRHHDAGDDLLLGQSLGVTGQRPEDGWE